jgi:hypothetical protein
MSAREKKHYLEGAFVGFMCGDEDVALAGTVGDMFARDEECTDSAHYLYPWI